jgi:hypothetical protein
MIRQVMHFGGFHFQAQFLLRLFFCIHIPYLAVGFREWGGGWLVSFLAYSWKDLRQLLYL